MTTEREREDSRRFLRRIITEESSTAPPRLWLAIIAVAAVLALAAAAAWFVSYGQTPVENAPSGQMLSGRVVSIADGDTFTLLDPTNTQIKVRLAEIDTPERDQPYANKAKQALSAMVFQQQVTVRVTDTDKYKRTVGRVYVGDVDVNAELVRQGAAWAYREHLRDQSLLALEAEAQAAGRGLWGLPEAQQVPPWDWRRGAGRPAAAGTVPPNPECAIKGNISKAGRIYHAPGMSSYAGTKIDESKGERWFCTEEEAKAAGWRPPRG